MYYHEVFLRIMGMQDLLDWLGGEIRYVGVMGCHPWRASPKGLLYSGAGALSIEW